MGWFDKSQGNTTPLIVEISKVKLHLNIIVSYPGIKYMCIYIKVWGYHWWRDWGYSSKGGGYHLTEVSKVD